ncbi:MAG TPA: hypothetical protein VHQ90_00350 [Thermoanaerobaculia bacterium]|nr:hypothetical protein [Thermoanaerobaculia bacterium]
MLAPLAALAAPRDAGTWLTLAGVLTFGAACGLLAAAVAAAR